MMKAATRLAVSACAWALATTLHAATPSGLDANGHLVTVPTSAQSGFSYVRLAGGLQIHVGGLTKNLIFYSPTSLRVNANLGQNYWEHPSIVVTDTPDPVAFDVTETATTLTLTSAKLTVSVDKATGALSFFDATGRLYTRESPTAPQSLTRTEISGAPTYEARNTFQLKPDEAIYGFGFLEVEGLNRRHSDLLLVQTNIGIVIPVMVSTERYGILWDTYSVMRFKDDSEGASLWAESAPGGVDYYFMAGQTMDDVVRDYRDLTGAAPMYPKQAFGLFMSKERYKTQARIVEVARTFRQEGFPLDYTVQDWQYWGSDTDGTWSGMIWNPERFPDPEGMTSAIHDLNMKLMISIWPSVGNDTELARDLDAQGLRFAPLHWISKKARIYDAFSPEGRRIYFSHIKSGLLDRGVDALWMDGTEVEVGTAAWNPQDNIRDIKSLGVNAMGDFSRYLNPYTLMTTQGTYDGQRATSNRRVFTLTRSAWAGAQRTGAASWSGDTFASWETFAQQIPGGVNVTITGNPYWTQDTGGFFVSRFAGGEQNPAWRELFARWFQYAAFNPIMRVHGTTVEREPYIFKELDPPVYDSLLDAVHLRYRMLPYTYALSHQVTQDGYTLMRALPMDFPGDQKTHNIKDEFMFGPSVLVHPVTRAMYNQLDPAAETIPATYLTTPDGKPGLAGQYFEGRNFETPKGQSIDPVIDFRWPEPPLAEPPPGLSGVQNFSARWQGVLTVPEDGEYELGIEGDDGFRLMVDGQTVAGEWDFGPMRYRSTRMTLAKGQKLAVTVEYYQGTGNRGLRLAWRTPSQIRALEAGRGPIDLHVQTYLPEGADWYDFWSGERFSGGSTVDREAPLDVIPLYVRAGSILPMGPVLQYATQMPDAPYEIRIYPGRDATFTLYEDDNETYNYEQGEFTTTELRWDDAKRTLSIGARKGSFPGMTARRTLNIVVMTAGTAGGIEERPAARSVIYEGKAMSLKLP